MTNICLAIYTIHLMHIFETARFIKNNKKSTHSLKGRSKPFNIHASDIYTQRPISLFYFFSLSFSLSVKHIAYKNNKNVYVNESTEKKMQNIDNCLEFQN